MHAQYSGQLATAGGAATAATPPTVARAAPRAASLRRLTPSSVLFDCMPQLVRQRAIYRRISHRYKLKSIVTDAHVRVKKPYKLCQPRLDTRVQVPRLHSAPGRRLALAALKSRGCT